MINHSRRHLFISQAALYMAAAVSLFAVREPRTSPFYSRVDKLKVAGSSPAPAPSLRAGRGFPSSRSRLSGVLFSLDVPLSLTGAVCRAFFWDYGRA